MTKDERAKVLRDRFKANGGFPYVPCGKTSRYVVLPKPTGKGFVSLGPALNSKPPRWMTMPDPNTKATLRLKHRVGFSALTKIAAKAPTKLVRTYRNAESMLAERAQR
jgi:hypothetical protein